MKAPRTMLRRSHEDAPSQNHTQNLGPGKLEETGMRAVGAPMHSAAEPGLTPVASFSARHAASGRSFVSAAIAVQAP